MRHFALLACFLMLVPTALADEGMWTIDNFPVDKVKKDHGVEITDDWLETVQLSTVRLAGCTGSFVSQDGLILTNNHCVWGCMRQLSSKENNLSENGFVASSREEESQCPTQVVSVLMEIEDVTKTIQDSVAGKTEKEANDARKKKRTELEKSCEDSSDGLRCESVSLYQGGQYFLYKYKRYDDVRLVFAPELDIGAFGGDPDNFNFPRWSLDYSFLRAYDEDGKPAKTPNYLTWRAEGPDNGEAVFISGHPGTTERLLTTSQLKFRRDVSIPNWLLRASELRGRMLQWAKTGDEPFRIINERVLGIENGLKVRRNQLFALLDDEQFARKAAEEQELRRRVAADPDLQKKYGDAWSSVDKAMDTYRSFYERKLFVSDAGALDSTHFRAARTFVRLAKELPKDNADRLREYRDTALPRLKQFSLAKRPIYDDYEVLRLTHSLEKAVEWLGPDDPFIKQVLGTKSPQELAKDLVSNTKLSDPEVRTAYWDGGQAAIDASDDPFIKLALALDDESRALRKRYENEVQAVESAAAEKIASARFAIYGTSLYPDATFTLRVTYGAVEGWKEKGEMVYPFTTLERLYERTTGKSPFKLPARWLETKDKLAMDTRFNYVATTDITGGNSGSPMVDKNGHLVGLAFDGNIHSITGAYWFDQSKNRTVLVHPAIMLKALETVYGADHVLSELSVLNKTSRTSQGSGVKSPASSNRPAETKALQ